MARPGFSKHPKFRRLVHILKEPMPHVRGYLELLWEVSYEAGNPVIGDETDIALACEYPGDAATITAALLKCGPEGGAGFIEPAPDHAGRYQIHDLYHHAPDYVQKRMERESARKSKGKSISDIRRESAQKRWSCDKCHTYPCKCSTLADRQDANGATPAPAPAPAPKRNTPAAQVCAEPSQATDSAPTASADSPQRANVAERKPADSPPAVPPSPTVLDFPIKGRNGGQWALTEAHVAEYVVLYPGVNVLAECRLARQWCLDHPSRQKTRNGIKGFITRWLGRGQDRLGMLGYSRNSTPPAGELDPDDTRMLEEMNK